MASSKKKLLGILAIGAVGGGLLYNMTGTASGDSSDNGSDNGNGVPEEDDIVAATELTKLTGGQRYTFREYVNKTAGPSLNPFNTVGGGNFILKGSSGSSNQYKWKDEGKKLKLIDHDGVGWFGGDDSGGMHLKIAKGFAVDIKVTSENTDYFSRFSGLKDAIANRDSKLKIVGSSQGDALAVAGSWLANTFSVGNDEISFRMYEGDYISIDIDGEHDGIGNFTFRIDGTKYDSSVGTVDDEVYIRLKEVYTVKKVDVWESETISYAHTPHTTVFYALAGGLFRRTMRRGWLKVVSVVGTKGMKIRAVKELADIASDVGVRKWAKLKDIPVNDLTNDLLAKTSADRLGRLRVRKGNKIAIGSKTYKGGQMLPQEKIKGKLIQKVNAKVAKEGGEAIGWKWLHNFPILKTSAGMGTIIGLTIIAGGVSDFLNTGLRELLMGPPCSEVCGDAYDEDSEEMDNCLEQCIESKDKKMVMLGGAVVIGGCVLTYVVLNRFLPKKKEE